MMNFDDEKIEQTILDVVREKRIPLADAARVVSYRLRRFLDAKDVYRVAENLGREAMSSTAVRNAVVDGGRYSESAPFIPAMAEGKQWDRYLSMLERKSSPGLAELSRTTEDVVRLLAPPSPGEGRRKGLVMGNVQSGKTRHFAGVIARAVDLGYRFVIVLSGLHNNLREQTQSRLDGDLFVDQEFWYHLTNVDNNDFDRQSELVSLMGSHSDVCLCAVVKKNRKRLGNLEVSLRNVPEEIRGRCPILVIDDEADQATPNSEKGREKVSAINAALRRIWELVPNGSYLAYTATPFANVLMDPDDDKDLFPSDFVYTLEAGDGYLGAEQVFGLADADMDTSGPVSDGLDMVRIIPPEDSLVLRPPSKKHFRGNFDPELPDSLVTAMRWFIVATAVRRARRHNGHSSMLVHTTHYTAPHFAMSRRLRDLLDDMRNAVESHREEGLAPLRESWLEEYARLGVPTGQLDPDWSAVAARIPGVLRDVEVIVDNGRSEDRLNYDDERPRTVVAVGGGTLSRGLTLEGLVVSYFTRTSNTYDTLMQMGRWFGYRPGYEDLPRIWVADGLDRDYAFLALVEKDLRDEIRSLENSEFTPRQVGVKVRCHPGRLEITAAGKMANARVVQVGMSGTRQQTFIMDGRPDRTRENFRAVEGLLRTSGSQPLGQGGHRWIFRGVPTNAVVDFLVAYQFHPDQKVFADPDLRHSTIDWLKRFAQGHNWDVVLVGNPKAEDSLGNLLIAGISVPRLRRTPLRGSTAEKLDFKAVMSSVDRLADIDPETYAEMPHATDPERMVVRRRRAGGDGLIVIYPISPASRNAKELRARMDMPEGVGEDLLGFGIVYPIVDEDSAEQGSFVSVKPLPDADLDEPEEDDEWEDEE